MFNSIVSALEDLKNGKMVIVLDDESRENEGDFLMAAEFATPEAINYMITKGKGLVCAPITQKKATKLGLAPMVESNDSKFHTAFTASIDHIDSTTGISANERSHSFMRLASDDVTADEFRLPGHIFPLIAKEGGVLERPGHTEATIDLLRLAGLQETGVICEIIKEDGTMARRNDLFKMAREDGLKIITIADLITFLLEDQKYKLADKITFPNKYGKFHLSTFVSEETGAYHLAITKGDISGQKDVAVRIHSECLTGDVFGSKRCDCGDQLEQSLQLMEEEGLGLLIYLKQEGRGIGLVNKIKAYSLQDTGLNTFEANEKLGFKDDERTYEAAVDILEHFNLSDIRLLTNNPHKLDSLKSLEKLNPKRQQLEIVANEVNLKYLMAKKTIKNHMILNKH